MYVKVYCTATLLVSCLLSAEMLKLKLLNFFALLNRYETIVTRFFGLLPRHIVSSVAYFSHKRKHTCTCDIYKKLENVLYTANFSLVFNGFLLSTPVKQSMTPLKAFTVKREIKYNVKIKILIFNYLLYVYYIIKVILIFDAFCRKMKIF